VLTGRQRGLPLHKGYTKPKRITIMPKDLNDFKMDDKDLPSMPIVAAKVMEILGNPDTTSQELNRIISADPAITAKILKICNSSFFSLSRKITSLTEAITYLGFNAIKSVVIVSSTKGIFKKSGLTERALWEHSVCCAISSNILAKDKRFGNYEEYFIGGLLHDIGKFVLDNKYPDDYQKIMKIIYNDPETVSVDVEIRLLNGLNHSVMGGLVIQKWKLSKLLNEAVEYHHIIENDQKVELENDTYSNVISFANLVCRKLGVGRGNPLENLDLSQTPPAKFLGLDTDYIDDYINRVFESFEAEKSLFE
jgi:HD-like signal output (HDOD) protein